MSTEKSQYEIQAEEFLSKTGTTFSATFLRHGKHFADDKEARDIYECTLQRGEQKYTFNFGQSIVNSCSEVMVPNEAEKIKVFAGLIFIMKDISCSVEFWVLKENGYALSVEEAEQLAGLMEQQYIEKIATNNKVLKNRYLKGDISKNEYLKKIGERNTDINDFIACINRAVKKQVEELVPKLIEKPVSDKIAPTAYDVLACLEKYEHADFEDFCSNYGYDTDSIKALKTYEACKAEYQALQALFSDEEMELLREIQ